jgi:hypothetical protein
MKSVDVKQFRAALNGGALLLEGTGPGKPALLILSSSIGKAVPRVATPSRLTCLSGSTSRRRKSCADFRVPDKKNETFGCLRSPCNYWRESFQPVLKRRIGHDKTLRPRMQGAAL